MAIKVFKILFKRESDNVQCQMGIATSEEVAKEYVTHLKEQVLLKHDYYIEEEIIPETFEEMFEY